MLHGIVPDCHLATILVHRNFAPTGAAAASDLQHVLTSLSF
jgi:hypothetical protein